MFPAFLRKMNPKLEVRYDGHLECPEDLQCLHILNRGSTNRLTRLDRNKPFGLVCGSLLWMCQFYKNSFPIWWTGFWYRTINHFSSFIHNESLFHKLRNFEFWFVNSFFHCFRTFLTLMGNAPLDNFIQSLNITFSLWSINYGGIYYGAIPGLDYTNRWKP